MRVTVRISLAALLVWLTFAPVAAQERFSPFVPSEQANVERMLKLAGIRDGDVIIDLGSGDGRIVLTAARMNPTVRGIGVDLDEKLVEKANAAAKAAGLADRVRFYHRNAFDADLSEVTIIAMWLWPEVQHMLRPKIFREARPGTRVITNLFEIGNWQPDQVDKDGPQVNLWIVPANVAGYWSWEYTTERGKYAYSAILEQKLQNADGFVRVGSRRAVLSDVKLNGAEISFSVSMTLEGSGYTRHEFTGRVKGDEIEGVVRLSYAPEDDEAEMQSKVLPWRARRTASSDYFAPTGTAAR